MSTDIFEYPPVERPYVAVRRFKLVLGDSIFERLLKYLELDETSFREEYGEKLIGNPACLNGEVAEMMRQSIKRGRGACSE